MRRRLLALLVLACCAAGAGAAEPEYPTRPIRLLVPFPPGGGADTLARILAPRLGEALGQPVVIDNRSGAAGNIAVELVAKAAPDGYTLLLTLNSVLTMNPNLYPDLPYNIERDLQPISQLSSGMYVLLLHPSVPATTVREFIEVARTKQGGLSYASAGVGSPLHLATELLKSRANINLVHVPYKGGGPAVVATIAGETQMTFASVAASNQHVRSGRLKAIAVTGSNRSKALPDLPTLVEAGFPGFTFNSWHALLMPAHPPEALLARLHGVTLKAAKLLPIQEAMTREGMETTTSRPADLAALIRRETDVWRGVIKSAGIRPE